MLGKSWLYKRFSKSEIPNWQCPTCNSGTLSLYNDFIEKESSEYQKVPDTYFDETIGEVVPFFKDDLPGLKGRFIGILKCNSKNCNEFVTIAGYISNEDYYYEDKDNNLEPERTDLFYPLHFDPALHIIQLYESYPKLIKDQLKICFALYWLDDFACANKIRSVVELLLDQLRVPRKQRKRNGTFTKLILHSRLEKFKEKNSEAADFLMSIKWIGNSGSHLSPLFHRDVLNAFYLLDHTLKQIYVKEHIKLKRLSKRINKNKKPLR